MISVNKRIGSFAVALALAAVAAGCGSDDSNSTATTAGPVETSTADTTAPSTEETTAPTTGDTTAVTETTGATGDAGDGVTAEGISDERCAANKAAGKITYLSSFDFAAAASIIDVVVAKDQGYFEAMCLDVEIKPSFSTSNYPLVAAGQAQFSSAGSYTEIVNFSTDGAEFVATIDYGKVPIEALVTPDGGATTLADLKGKTIGVKGDLPPSIVALLAKNGLVRGTDYNEILLDGFDPVAQLAQGIDALPVYKSNEPGQLDAAGVKYNLFDPADEDIPGSFGLIYTSKDFAEANPTVVEDFTRAALHGMEFAIADPAAAVGISIAEIDAAGNQNFLTEAGETFRLQQEIAAAVKGTPAGSPVGLIDPDLFKAEYDAYVEAGVWPDGAPEYGEYFDATVAAGVYGDDGTVIWPS
jgi:ABC-type nitrate/sulfonate/bicarbonate transport system substrate-binding protein